MKLKNLQMPKFVQKDETTYSETYGCFIVEPLEKGFGTTLGNALRRVLLMSLQGASVVSVKIEGVQHEYSAITGVKEDVAEIILNRLEKIFQIPRTRYHQKEVTTANP